MKEREYVENLIMTHEVRKEEKYKTEDARNEDDKNTGIIQLNEKQMYLEVYKYLKRETDGKQGNAMKICSTGKRA